MLTTDYIIDQDITALLKDAYAQQDCCICIKNHGERMPCIKNHPGMFLCRGCYDTLCTAQKPCPLCRGDFIYYQKDISVVELLVEIYGKRIVI